MMQLKNSTLVEILGHYYLTFVSEVGVIPTTIKASQRCIDLLNSVYSWQFKPLYIYGNDVTDITIIAGKLYGLEVVIDESIELFELSVES